MKSDLQTVYFATNYHAESNKTLNETPRIGRKLADTRFSAFLLIAPNKHLVQFGNFERRKTQKGLITVEGFSGMRFTRSRGVLVGL